MSKGRNLDNFLIAIWKLEIDNAYTKYSSYNIWVIARIIAAERITDE